MGNRRVSIRLVLATCCLVVTACGSGLPASIGDGVAGQQLSASSQEAAATPLLESPSVPGPDTSHNKQQRSIQECMAAAGFEYLPDIVAESPETSTAIELFTPSNVDREARTAEASTHGFGMYAWSDGYQTVEPDPTTLSDDNTRIVESLGDEARASYYEALVGDGGCISTAQAEAPIMPTMAAEDAELVWDLMLELEQRLDADTRVRAARTDYQACMKDAGFDVGTQPVELLLEQRFAELTGFDYASEGRNHWADIDPTVQQDLIAEEQSAALADSTCSIPLEDVWNQVGEELEAELLAAHPELQQPPG